ncbi:MAG: glycosyltransferase [Thermoleophilaceae bacterium]
MDLSYCVVNTNGREYLRACLAAIERTHPAGLEHEILVLDNRSDDGSVEMVRDQWPSVRLIALDRRAGKAENDSTLLREAAGRYCLLLNEDSELCEGAVGALVGAMDAHPSAGAAGARLLTSEGAETACAWRLPGLGVSLAGALFLHRRLHRPEPGLVPPARWAGRSRAR